MMNLLSSKRFFIVVIFIQVLLLLWVRNDPFFGDARLCVSSAALLIYDHNLLSVFFPHDIDPGHPTLYAWLLALCWKIFGQTLLASHIFASLWVIGLTWAFRKAASTILEIRTANLATILVMCFATYLSMSATVLNTVALMMFFLLAIYGLLSKNNLFFLVASVLMMLTHLQSSFFLLSLACSDAYIAIIRDKISFFAWLKKRFWFYALPFFVFAGWLAVHYQYSGWLFQSPNYSDASEMSTWKSFLKSIPLIVWRLVDYGMLPVHIIACVAIIQKRTDKRFAAVYVISLIVTSVLMALFLDNTIAHRYFLPFQFMAIIIAIDYLTRLQVKQAVVLYSLCGISMLAGNFLYYPGKTIGDATLAYRSYFTLEKQVQQDFGDSLSFYSYGPIGGNTRYKWLNEKGLNIIKLETEDLSNVPVVIQSNVNGGFTPEMKEELEHNWYGTSYEQGPVYLNVFLNPRFYSKPENWHLREPSTFEKWMSNMKKKLK